MSKEFETPNSISSESSRFPQVSEVNCIIAIMVCTAAAAFSINFSYAIPFTLVSSVSLLNLGLLIGVNLLLLRSNSQIQNTGLAFVISFWSIIIFNLSTHMAFIGLPFCMIISPLVLWLTKSYMHCITALFVQLINISLLFRVNLEECIKYLPVEKLTERLIQCLILGIFLIVIMFGYVFRTKQDSNTTYDEQLTTTQSTIDMYEVEYNEKKLLNSYLDEVKSVIQTISGSLSLLRQHMEPGLGMKLVKIANISTESLQRMIYNMTDIKHEEIENRKSVPVYTCVQSFFQNIWESSLTRLQQKGLGGICKIDRTIPEVLEIDSAKIQQILANVMDYFVNVSSTKAPVELTIEPLRNMHDSNFFGFMPLPEEVAVFKGDETGNVHRGYGYVKNAHTLKVMNKRDRMLKITIKNMASKEYSENFEEILSEIEDDELHFLTNNEMVKLGLEVSKKLTKKIGGKLKAYGHSKVGTAFVVYVPYDSIEEKTKFQNFW